MCTWAVVGDGERKDTVPSCVLHDIFTAAPSFRSAFHGPRGGPIPPYHLDRLSQITDGKPNHKAASWYTKRETYNSVCANKTTSAVVGVLAVNYTLQEKWVQRAV